MKRTPGHVRGHRQMPCERCGVRPRQQDVRLDFGLEGEVIRLCQACWDKRDARTHINRQRVKAGYAWRRDG